MNGLDYMASLDGLLGALSTLYSNSERPQKEAANAFLESFQKSVGAFSRWRRRLLSGIERSLGNNARHIKLGSIDDRSEAIRGTNNQDKGDFLEGDCISSVLTCYLGTVRFPSTTA